MKVRIILLACMISVFISCSDEVRNNLIIEQIDILFQQGRYEEAKTSVDSFVVVNPKNEMAWTLKGHIEECLENDSVSEFAYNKALSIKPNMEQALTGMGILSRKKGEYDQAAGYYTKAIEANPNYAEAYSSLVTIELKRKNFENAVKFGEKGYILDKKNPVIAANLSIAYHYYGDSTNRDKFFVIAKQLKYQNLDILQLIFNGKATILDD